MKGKLVDPGSPTESYESHTVLQLFTLLTFKESHEKSKSDPGVLILAKKLNSTVTRTA